MSEQVVSSGALPSRTSGVVSTAIMDLLNQQAALFDQNIKPAGNKNWLVIGGVILLILVIVKKVG